MIKDTQKHMTLVGMLKYENAVETAYQNLRVVADYLS